jgi:transcriptional regulator with PAS, ATPase and Fis domain
VSEWETALRTDGASESLRVRAVTLTVRQGPDAGKRVRVETPTFLVGSGDSADLRLGDTTVSRAHLSVLIGASGVTIRDEESRNGTFIGPVRIREAELTGDASVRIGETTIEVALDGGLSDLPLSGRDRFGEAIGVSPAMRHAFALLERAARSDVTVLCEGESGVGKDILARGLHTESPRADAPFVTVDCAAIPETLIESELFGYVRGAFTGAVQDRMGLVEQAEGGTLFLDEIGELPGLMQPKLLRVLEAREIRPLGARAPKKIDVRVVAATNRRLADQVARGEFRKDLYYRLSVARIAVPPLRDRVDDIEPLATLFLRRVSGDPNAVLGRDLVALMRSYRWPGNVRELRNVVERHALLGLRDAASLFDEALPAGEAVSEGVPSRSDEALLTMPFHEARKRTLEAFERSYLTRALERADGVITRAAQLAGIARPSFHRMLDRLGLARDDTT